MITGRAVSALLLHHHRRVAARRAVNYDFAGALVLWCTGFGHDFSWIDLPGIRPGALPDHERGVSSAQKGLYFVGLPFLTTLASAFLGGVDPDARFVVDNIRSEIARSSNKPPFPPGALGRELDDEGTQKAGQASEGARDK